MYANNPTALGNGTRNTGIGLQTLYRNTTGYSNTAVGFQTLVNNTIGYGNTSIGDVSLASNTLGANNIALGFGAAYNNTTSSNNIAIGTNALRSQTFNNSNTVYNSWNIAIGRDALYSNDPSTFSNGMLNVAIGASSFRSNITSNDNTGLGTYSGYYATSGSNTFIGSYSGYGVSAALTTGNANTAVGNRSLGLFTTGYQNTAMGDYALYNNAAGFQNTALGAGALDYNTTGNRNTGVGFWTGRNGVTPFTGSDNFYAGYNAGNFNYTGSNNTLIGSNTNVNTSTLTYATALGSGATVNCSSCLALGGTTGASRTRVGIGTNAPTFFLDVNFPTGVGNGVGVQNTNNTAGWELYQSGAVATPNFWFNYNGGNVATINSATGAYTATSDRRLKTNIKPVESILNKVMLLQPTRYEYIKNNPLHRQSLGLIAQDVELVFPEFVYKTDMTLDNPNSDINEQYSLDYAGMSVIAIKAIQEQQKIIEALTKRIEELEAKTENKLQK